MANIVQQADLLKGIPDDRLSLLLQKPDASIPPFLVAAEAQRRQAIRQQFAGSGTNESVVDTLTKQLSNVPQNIQAPKQTPPTMPPPMQPQMQQQMAGIGALPQGQRTMAGGGPVRRFAPGGYVEPMWKIPNYSGVIPRVGDWVGGKTKELYEYATTPWGETEAPTSPSESSGIDFSLPDITLPNPNPNFAKDGEPSPYTDLTTKPKKPPSSTTGTEDTSAENKYKSMEADMRKRLEDLYAVDEPSNWEEAQKWFAMSQAIMQPDQNLIQSLASAGAIYSGAEGQQAADERAALRDREEALLKYDMEIYSSDREAESANAAARVRAQTDIATGQINDIRNERNRLYDQLSRIQEDADKNGIPVDPARVRAIQSRIDSLGAEMEAYKSYIQNQYGFNSIPTVDIASGTIK
jgi:hypothetical protein